MCLGVGYLGVVEVDALDLVALTQQALAWVAAGHGEEDALVVIHLCSGKCE